MTKTRSAEAIRRDLIDARRLRADTLRRMARADMQLIADTRTVEHHERRIDRLLEELHAAVR